MAFDLYPAPTKIKISNDWLNLSNCYLISVPKGISPKFQQAIARLVQTFPDPRSSLTFGNSDPESTLILIRRPVKKMGLETSEITISDRGIELGGGSEQGLYYGLITLGQLLQQSPSKLPHLHIEDKPDFSARGVMLDVSRCKVPKLATLFDLIEKFSQLKYNQLQLYTEHTFQFIHHPQVWQDASPYTSEDMIKIQAFCDSRYIELVPNLNSFGHMERWLRYPAYHQYAECPNGFTHPLSGQQMEFGSSLTPGNKSLKFLKSLYDEYLPLFSSSQFNVGGDEPWELGEGRSKNRCEQSGKTTIYLGFIAEIQKMVEARGRHMQFWGDIILEDKNSLKTVSKNTTALNWGYEANHPFNKECRSLGEAGLSFYVVPGTSSWNSITGRTSNVVANLESAAKNGLKYGATGYLITDWGDHGHHQYQPVSYLGYLIGACQAWNHESARKLDASDAIKGINTVFFKDKQDTTGSVFYQLGKVLELAPSDIQNATIFNRLLFWDMKHAPSAMKGITEKQLNLCLQRFAELKEEANTIRCESEDRDTLKAELANAISMAELAIKKHFFFLGNDSDKSLLKRQARDLIKDHQKLWLARNRPGGLKESLAHLSRGTIPFK